MADWPFPPPSPETTGSILSAVSGAIVGSLSRKSRSRWQWISDIFIGLSLSFILGGAVIAATGIDSVAVYGVLAFCGVPLVARIRSYAEKAKIGDLPPIEEEKEA